LLLQQRSKQNLRLNLSKNKKQLKKQPPEAMAMTTTTNPKKS
jgi:hypothetical protein